MKTKLKVFFCTVALITFITSCNKDSDTPPITDEVVVQEPIEEEVPIGTVSLNTIVKDMLEIQTGKATLDEILDNLYVDISEGPPVLRSYYRDLPDFIELPISDSYKIILSTPMPSIPRFDIGRYGHDIEWDNYFSITEGENTVVDIVLSLWDVAATIDFSDEVLQSYPAIEGSAYINYSNGESSTPLNWSTVDDSRTGFFVAIQEFDGLVGSLSNIDLIVEISAFDSANNEIIVSKTYPNVIANQHYRISVSYGGASTASLNITLGEEEIIDDTIIFPN